MKIHRAYKYELDPTNKQRTILRRHAGTARFAYNWGLEQRIHMYQKKVDKERFTNAMVQHRVLNSLKKTHYPWMYQVSKCAPQEALRDLQQVFKYYYHRIVLGKVKAGFPKFRRKGFNDRFRLTGRITFVGRFVQLPRLGQIRLKEKRTWYYRGRILSATVSRQVDRWFVAVIVEGEIKVPLNEGPAVGVDLGVKTVVQNLPIPDRSRVAFGSCIIERHLPKGMNLRPQTGVSTVRATHGQRMLRVEGPRPREVQQELARDPAVVLGAIEGYPRRVLFTGLWHVQASMGSVSIKTTHY